MLTAYPHREIAEPKLLQNLMVDLLRKLNFHLIRQAWCI